METIFSEKDFMLCNAPVPAGYPQSQTHTGVAKAGNRLYLTTSPFPVMKYGLIQRILNKVCRLFTNGVYPPIYGDAQENPMLYWGEERELHPTEFTPYIGNPLAPRPTQLFGYHSYNSDPDIFAEGDEIYILNRECYKKSKAGDYWCRIVQFHFTATSEGADYASAKVLLETPTLFLSPSIAKKDGVYYMFNLETSSYNTGTKECHLYLRQSNRVDGQYDAARESSITSGIFVPWHLSVFSYKEELYAIVACIKEGQPKRLYQMMGKFNKDLSSLHIYQCPLADMQSYRGAAYIDNKGDFVLYNTTVGVKIKGGKSVDGREIIMASKKFEDVLEILRANEG